MVQADVELVVRALESRIIDEVGRERVEVRVWRRIELHHLLRYRIETVGRDTIAAEGLERDAAGRIERCRDGIVDRGEERTAEIALARRRRGNVGDEILGVADRKSTRLNSSHV